MLVSSEKFQKTSCGLHCAFRPYSPFRCSLDKGGFLGLGRFGVRGILQKKMDALFEGFDVLAAASLPIVATPLETNLETDLNFPDPLGGIGNLCGLPVISVPCGFSEANLPVGLQFAGRVRNDRAVIAAAHLFQQLTDLHTRRPPVA